MKADKGLTEFLVSHGGPFYDLQRQLGLIRKDTLLIVPRMLVFTGLAWGVPLLISAAQGNAYGPAAEGPYLLDLGVWARFLVAVGLFIFMEGQVEQSLRKKLAQFVRAPIIATESMDAAAAAVSSALRQRDSRPAEIVCLVLAGIMTSVSLRFLFFALTSSWAVTISPDGNSLTIAGWWCLLISAPIFWFLLFRGLWRHLVWAMLLRRIAALKLRLVSTHPDHMGGLAFIGQYPNAYATFVFAISCVLGAAIAKEFLNDRLPSDHYAYIMGAWLIIVLALFAVPLLAFRKPLALLKEETLLAAAAQATRFQRMTEKKLLGRNISAPENAEAAGDAEVPDPTKLFEATNKLTVLVFSRTALIPVGAAAILPLAVAGIAKLPVKELLTIVKRLLLL
jgi:hypothetical protein